MAAAFGQAEEGAPDGGRRAVSSPETASSARSACAPVCQCVRVPAVGEKDAHTGGRNEQCAGGRPRPGCRTPRQRDVRVTRLPRCANRSREETVIGETLTEKPSCGFSTHS